MKGRTKLRWIAGVFLAACYVPVGHPRVRTAILGSFFMLRDYAQEHALTCLVPAFFIAGAIAVFIRRAAVLKYLGARAERLVACTAASVSGTVLAVCSWTVLPLFAGICSRGAGIGPATAFLYSGPAINVLGPKRTAVFVAYAVLLSTAAGLLFGALFPQSPTAGG
ncbi:MAG: hypothetical protein Kow0092_34430 [Deferrisomatales bacterium]